MFEPAFDKLIVRPVEAAKESAGGIILVKSAQHHPHEGEVIAVGPGKLLQSGDLGPMPYRPGDKVVYSKYGGIEMKIDGERVVVLTLDDIVGRLK